MNNSSYKHMNVRPMGNAWDYARVSGERDDKKDSIEHQHTMNKGFCRENNINIVGSSEDEISGMTFERPGLISAFNAAKAGLIDTIIVKEISRFGRERGLTLYYVDKLRKMGIRIYSVSENIDSMIESNDLIIGIKCVVNDSEPKSASRRVSSMFESIMREEGLVCVPPFGLRKDKNTGNFYIVEECADIIRLIHQKFQEGYGLKNLTLYLTENHYPSPQYYHDLFYPGKKKQNKQSKTKVAEQYWWNDRTIKNILKNEAYIGTLVCHTTARSTIYNYKKVLPPEDHIRHEDYYPPILSGETWNKTQEELRARNRHGNRLGAGTITNQRKHLFAGLLRCGDCNATFTAKHRKLEGNEYVEYICNNYHRFGKKYCTSHRVTEKLLIDSLYSELLSIAKQAKMNIKMIDSMIKMWRGQKNYENMIVSQLEKKIASTENTIKELILAMAKATNRQEYYDQLIVEQENQLTLLRDRLREAKAKIGSEDDAEIKSALLNYEKIIIDVLRGKEIDPQTLSRIIEKVVISECDGELIIKFILRLPFEAHRRLYDEVYTPIEYAKMHGDGSITKWEHV